MFASRPLTRPAPPAAYDAASTEELLGPDGRVVSLVAGTALEAPVSAAAAALLSARHTAAANIDYFAEPSSKKLLPDLPPHAASYMRTLGASHERAAPQSRRVRVSDEATRVRAQCLTWTACW